MAGGAFTRQIARCSGNCSQIRIWTDILAFTQSALDKIPLFSSLVDLIIENEDEEGKWTFIYM